MSWWWSHENRNALFTWCIYWLWCLWWKKIQISETLEVKFKGKSIYDVLEMSVQEAYDFFVNNPRIKNKLATLKDVGLGYIKLGQRATTLSGGEAQRLNLQHTYKRNPQVEPYLY